MRTIRSLLARACLRLYPSSWRDRYADEVLLLVEEAEAGIGDLVDLAIGGLGRRADELQGGAPMPSFVRAASLILAAVVALPTAVFIGLQLLNRNVAFFAIEQPLGIDFAPHLDWLIPVLPAVALLIALAPVVRVGTHRDEAGAVTVTTRILPMRRALVAVVTVCLALLGVVVAYGISENLLEGLR
jgi:hypothetical protein